MTQPVTGYGQVPRGTVPTQQGPAQTAPGAQPTGPAGTAGPVGSTLPRTSTVLVVDDHRIVRESLSQLVAEVPGVRRVVAVGTGEEALARYEAERPDLVLMDVQMPGLGGLETTRRLVQRWPSATVLMLTAADDRDQAAAAIAGGAKGYLLKDVSAVQLSLAVQHVLAGEDLVEPSLRRAMEERAAAGRLTEPHAVLTERELQVLRGMAQGKSNAEIGRSLFLSEDTIKTHARRLFRKLGVNDRAQAVALGFRRGLVQ